MEGPRKIYFGGWGALEALFQPPPPWRGGLQGSLFFPCFSSIFHDKTTGTVTVTVTVSLQGEGGGGLLLWLSADLIPPPPISKLEPKFSDICIEEIGLWPLEPLFATPTPSEFGGGGGASKGPARPQVKSSPAQVGTWAQSKLARNRTPPYTPLAMVSK